MSLTSAVTLTNLSWSIVRTGEPVSHAEAARRVGHLLDLVEDLGSSMIARYDTPRSRAALASGVDREGRNLPAKAEVSARRLRWAPYARDIEGLRIDTRVARLAAHGAVLAVRLRCREEAVLLAVLSVATPTNSYRPTSEAVRSVVPVGTRPVTTRALLRRVRAYAVREGRAPSRLEDLGPSPRAPRTAVLGTVDYQMGVVEEFGDHLVVRVKLPRIARPRSRVDYEWVRVSSRVPSHLRERVVTRVALPTLRILDGRPVLDVALEESVPSPTTGSPSKVLGLDWGVNTLFVGSMVERSEERGRLTTDARAYEFDGDGLVEKGHRLREHSEHLRAKVARYEALLTGCSEDPDLLRLRDRARTEADHVDRRRRMIGIEVANLAARGFVDLAVARGVEAIAVEDLSGLEAGGLGRATNTRVSSSVRGRSVNRLRHAAAREGVRVIEVPARGTSSLCVGCDEKVFRPRYSVSECRRCGISGADRDLVASAKVASRAIAGRVRRSRDGTESVTKVVFEPVRRSRAKTGPTPSQHRVATLGRRKLTRTRTSPLSPPPMPARAHRRPGHASSPTTPSSGVLGQGVSDLGLAGPGALPALPVPST